MDKRLDSLQNEWSTLFARIEALLTVKPVFSPVKAAVTNIKSPATSAVWKNPSIDPSVSD